MKIYKANTAVISFLRELGGEEDENNFWHSREREREEKRGGERETEGHAEANGSQVGGCCARF